MNQMGIRRLRESISGKDIKKKHAFLRAISGSSRFRILVLLKSRKAGLTVTTIAEALGASTSRVSHQMRILRKHGLVNAIPNGREKIYRSKTSHRFGFL